MKEIVFSFYNGQLFCIAASYDRYETECLTRAGHNRRTGSIGGAVANCEAPFRTDPIHLTDPVQSYGPSFRLVGVLRDAELPDQISIGAVNNTIPRVGL